MSVPVVRTTRGRWLRIGGRFPENAPTHVANVEAEMARVILLSI